MFSFFSFFFSEKGDKKTSLRRYDILYIMYLNFWIILVISESNRVYQEMIMSLLLDHEQEIAKCTCLGRIVWSLSVSLICFIDEDEDDDEDEDEDEDDDSESPAKKVGNEAKKQKLESSSMYNHKVKILILYCSWIAMFNWLVLKK